MNERQGIFVYIRHLKHAKSLRKYGHVHYISKRMKYVHLYCNMDETDHLTKRIEKLPFVKKIVVSHRPSVATEYETIRPDKAKEYDYKIGL